MRDRFKKLVNIFTIKGYTINIFTNFVRNFIENEQNIILIIYFMKRNLLLLIGLIAIVFPMNLKAQEGPKISGFVQGLWQGNLNDNGKVKSNTFQARRVRMSVEGTLVKDLTYKIQGDFIRKPMLVDFFLKYKVCDGFAIQAGQFKTPFSMESPINPVNLEIFDYGESVQQLSGYNDICGVGSIGRDLGIMASGKLFKLEGNDFALVDYSIGVFNGNGANEKDNNNRKDFVGKLEIHPMLKDLTLSGSYYYGWYDKNYDTEETYANIHNGARQRWSAGIQYSDGDIMVRAEYLNGITGYKNKVYDSIGYITGATDELIWTSTGYYAVAGYNFRFGNNDSQKLMPVLRYEHFTKDAAVANGGTNYYTVGVNYWPMKSLNFKLDYSLIQPETGAKSHRVVGILSYKF